MTPRGDVDRRWFLRGLASACTLLPASLGGLWLVARDALGGRASGARRTRIEQSPQWKHGRFDNALPRIDGPLPRALGAYLFGGSAFRKPTGPMSLVARTGVDYAVPPASGLRVTWLGHSTLLLEIDGHRILIDPVWGERASPFPFMGAKRFHAPPLPLDQLPTLDTIVISHDHYDHLDVQTIRALSTRTVRWLVPLGVGAHLVTWGVPEDRIVEFDWWESVEVSGLTITATPARHFSGRGLFDANQTLWAGWAFAGPRHRVFYSGDTAMHEEFAEIGRRLGPFDLTMIESGAYDALWADVHLGPEQAVLAHRQVRGDVLLPVHWGTFDLALHGWTEPMERVLVAAAAAGVRVAAPRPGEMVEPATLTASARWWPDEPWQREAEAPVRSSGLESAR